MATATNHEQSITLPHCWVCSTRFTDSKPPGLEHREEHHIIPRAYGGVDGPTVSLCTKHHTALHKIADALWSNKPYFIWLQDESDQAKQKLMWLATRVYNAKQLMHKDPNKHTIVLLSLDAKQQHMVDQLRKVYPSLRSREALFNAALSALYHKHFIQE